MSKKHADELLEKAYDSYASALEKFCRARLGEAYESTNDCVQEAFCVYYKRLLGGERFDNPRAFLYRTANNMVLRAKEEYFKNASRTKSFDDAENELSQIIVEFEDSATDCTDYDKLRDVLIARLNENEQKLYHMKYIQKMSLIEIGNALGIPPNTAAKRLSRMREKIKRLVEPILEEYEKGESAWSLL